MFSSLSTGQIADTLKLYINSEGHLQFPSQNGVKQTAVIDMPNGERYLFKNTGTDNDEKICVFLHSRPEPKTSSNRFWAVIFKVGYAIRNVLVDSSSNVSAYVNTLDGRNYAKKIHREEAARRHYAKHGVNTDLPVAKSFEPENMPLWEGVKG